MINLHIFFVTKKETLPQKEEKDDRGLVLPRNVSCNWCIKISEYYLENIWKLMFSKLKKNCQLIHIDETTIQCNHEANKKASSNSYMWVMTSGEDEKCKGVIFRYSPSRAEKVAKELLSGYLGIQEHIKKPDEKVFNILLQRYNLKAEECLFIDDDDTGKSYKTANEMRILGRVVIPNNVEDIKQMLSEFKIEL